MQLMLEFLRFTKCSYMYESGAPGAEENELGVHSRGGASEETEDFLFLMQAVINQALGSAAQIANKGKRRRRRAQHRDKQQVRNAIFKPAERGLPLLCYIAVCCRCGVKWCMTQCVVNPCPLEFCRTKALWCATCSSGFAGRWNWLLNRCAAASPISPPSFGALVERLCGTFQSGKSTEKKLPMN